MSPNCLTTTFDRLHRVGGRFVAAASRRSPLMHVWHEADDGVVTAYEPDRKLKHWALSLFGYRGRITDRAQQHARPMSIPQIVASAWVLALTATVWGVIRAIRGEDD